MPSTTFSFGTNSSVPKLIGASPDAGTTLTVAGVRMVCGTDLTVVVLLANFQIAAALCSVRRNP